MKYYTSNNKNDLTPLGGIDSINTGDPIERSITLLGTESGNILSLSHISTN